MPFPNPPLPGCWGKTEGRRKHVSIPDPSLHLVKVASTQETKDWEPQSLLFSISFSPLLTRQSSGLSWNTCKGHSGGPSGPGSFAPPARSLLGVTWGPLVLPGVPAKIPAQRRSCSDGEGWRGPGDPMVLPAAAPARGRSPRRLRDARLVAFRERSRPPSCRSCPHPPSSRLTGHLSLGRPRLGPGGCGTSGCYTRRAGSTAAGSTKQDRRRSLSRLSARKGGARAVSPH